MTGKRITVECPHGFKITTTVAAVLPGIPRSLMMECPRCAYECRGFRELDTTETKAH